MIIRDRDLMYDKDGNLNTLLIAKCISTHLKEVRSADKNRVASLQELYNYYTTNNDSLKTTSVPVNYKGHKIITNHAKEIVDTFVGYVYGKPISYKVGNNDEIAKDLIDNHFNIIDECNHNHDLGINQSIFGKAYELIELRDTDYDEGILYPYFESLSPLDTFVVYDNTVEHKPMFAVTYREHRNIDDVKDYYNIWVYTDLAIYQYKTDSSSLESVSLRLADTGDIPNPSPHLFGDVPIIRLLNNQLEHSDFEDCLGLIDAYNDLQFNRIKDKQDYIEKLLLVLNASFGDTLEEQSKTYQAIKKKGVIELETESNLNGGSSKTADIRYLNETFDENNNEIIRKALLEDIHKVSKCPDTTDKEFAGNSSGEALKLKFFPTEQVCNIKDTMLRRLIIKRLKLIKNYYKSIKKEINVSNITFTMNRNIPIFKNEQLELQKFLQTKGEISWETRFREYRPEDDVEQERERLKKEREENMNSISMAFNPNQNPKDDINAIKENANKQEELNSDEDNNSKKDKDEELDEKTNVENSKNNKKKK